MSIFCVFRLRLQSSLSEDLLCISNHIILLQYFCYKYKQKVQRSYKYWRFTQGLMWRSPVWSMASGGWAWHGGAAEQKVSRRVALSAGGRLSLTTVNTLIWQRSLEGAASGRWTRKQWLQTGMETDKWQDSGETRREMLQMILLEESHSNKRQVNKMLCQWGKSTPGQ